jgi:hypothetical protein
LSYTASEVQSVLRNQPVNGPAAIGVLAPTLRRSFRDRLSGRAALTLVGGTSLLLWAGILSLLVHLWS